MHKSMQKTLINIGVNKTFANYFINFYKIFYQVYNMTKPQKKY
jgi:hypothetical protein